MEKRNFFCNGSGTELVDMSLQQTIGMFIVTAEHDLFGIFAQELDQRIKVFGCTSFSDQDLHPALEFIFRFFVGETFMVSTDTGINISLCFFSTKSGSMSIYRFTSCFCRFYLL